ncbi:flagellar motor switch protein FliG [Clostridiaceae bacterium HSG29]|nr:flagellar motor switch protein FliG [Clostridiaceae bacterium HSG29]
MAKSSGMSGKEKAAILLIAIGPEKSAEIFKNLDDMEIEELTLEIANMRQIDPNIRESILEEFYQICLAQEFVSEGGISYAKTVLEEAMGSQKALEVINKLTSSLQVKPFEFVRKVDPSQLLNFIQKEHAQTIALVLSYLPPNLSSAVISSLPQNKQADVAERIATMDSTSPEVIKEVEMVLEKKFSSMATQDYASTGGIDAIVEILNAVDRGTEKYIMETLEIDNPELAEEISQKMFVFEDITTLDSVSIQRFIREIENDEMTVALKGSTEEVKEIILGNMSSRMAEMIEEDMEFMGPVRLSDVEEAQQKIVAVIRKLEEAGEIIISRGGGDELIV